MKNKKLAKIKRKGKLPAITIDFETRSVVDLRKCGLHVYAVDPSTQVMCLAYKIGHGKTKLWHRSHPHLPQSPIPTDLLKALSEDRLLEAHNASFERAIWKYVLTREYPFFPQIEDSRWRCSAAKAAVLALPRSLAKLGEAMKLSVVKDSEGYRVMLKLCKPRNPRKAERELYAKEYKAYQEWEKKALEAHELDIDFNEEAPTFTLDLEEPLFHESPEDIQTLHDYCIKDVDTEFAASQAMKDLSPREQIIFGVDQRMNLRGILCDVELAKAAICLSEHAVKILNFELSDLTDGEVPRASTRSKLIKWMNNDGCPLPNTKKETIERLLADETIIPKHKRILEICRSVNRTSTAKYKKLIDQVGEDNRLRDAQLYHGASTGRWAGRGFQPHNLVRGYTEEMEEICSDILAEAHRLVTEGSTEIGLLEMLWGDTMDALSKATRGCLIASEGYELMVADYSAIEARCLLWLAEDERGLDVFYRGDDPYKDMATSIYNISMEEVGTSERFIGKQAVLGLGYGMGAEKFDDTCANYGVHESRAFFSKVVKIYRKEKYPKVASFWEDTAAAAIKAVQTGGKISCRKTEWFVEGDFLFCKLPSGRCLAYYKPEIREMETFHFDSVSRKGKSGKIMVKVDPSKTYDTWEEALFRAKRRAKDNGKKLLKSKIYSPKRFIQPTLTVMGSIGHTFDRHDLYGGMLVENITQAVARDIMADAMIEIDRHKKLELLMTVHDEIVSESPVGTVSMEEYIGILENTKDWAKGCPIKAEGWKGKRYKK